MKQQQRILTGYGGVWTEYLSHCPAKGLQLRVGRLMSSIAWHAGNPCKRSLSSCRHCLVAVVIFVYNGVRVQTCLHGYKEDGWRVFVSSFCSYLVAGLIASEFDQCQQSACFVAKLSSPFQTCFSMA
jgi:hypothetical protein